MTGKLYLAKVTICVLLLLHKQLLWKLQPYDLSRILLSQCGNECLQEVLAQFGAIAAQAILHGNTMPR